jgi:antitoxin (DNA-binding transcriptional repressor) of toxin-antitoxin stability system
MKKINQEVSMAGKLETITVMDFRRTPGEVFGSVALGKTFVITKSGKAVAVLSKPPGDTLCITVGTKGEISYTK